MGDLDTIFGQISGLTDIGGTTSDVGQADIIDVERNSNLGRITDAGATEAPNTNSEKDDATRTSVQIYCSVATKKEFEYAARLMGDTLSSAGRRALEEYIDNAFMEGLKIFNKYGEKR